MMEFINWMLEFASHPIKYTVEYFRTTPQFVYVIGDIEINALLFELGVPVMSTLLIVGAVLLAKKVVKAMKGRRKVH